MSSNETSHRATSKVECDRCGWWEVDATMDGRSSDGRVGIGFNKRMVERRDNREERTECEVDRMLINDSTSLNILDQRPNHHHADEEPSAESIPSEYCNQLECVHLPTVYLRKSIVADLVEFLPYLESSALLLR